LNSEFDILNHVNDPELVLEGVAQCFSRISEIDKGILKNSEFFLGGIAQ
jgi:hypothetical protein